MSDSTTIKKAGRKNVILLGLTSLITDSSSEIIFPLMPFFLTALVALGGSVIEIGLLIGFIGGLGDSLSSVLKAISGFWSDKIHKKKPFVVAGYSISAGAKLFFPLSINGGQVAAVRVIERTGKGIRDAPRDAIIAESTEAKKGMGFGIHRALDSAGAVIGTLVALLFILIIRPDSTDPSSTMAALRIIFFFAAGLAFFSLIPLLFVKSKEGEVTAKYKLGFRNLTGRYWLLILITGLFSLGNFTYMFFVFQTSSYFPDEWALITPLALYILFNIVYTCFSIPGGLLSDRIGKSKILIMGYGFFGLTCLNFIFSNTLYLFILGFCLYGLSFALIETVQRALVSDITSPEIRGTALGTFHTITGLAALPAGLIAGYLFDIAPFWTFLYGAIIALISLILLTIYASIYHPFINKD
ncbi:MAG: MFS transporter [Candidatus Helarchaeota archaeon]